MNKPSLYQYDNFRRSTFLFLKLLRIQLPDNTLFNSYKLIYSQDLSYKKIFRKSLATCQLQRWDKTQWWKERNRIRQTEVEHFNSPGKTFTLSYFLLKALRYFRYFAKGNITFFSVLIHCIIYWGNWYRSYKRHICLLEYHLEKKYFFSNEIICYFTRLHILKGSYIYFWSITLSYGH